jgi:hypothetical protein
VQNFDRLIEKRTADSGWSRLKGAGEFVDAWRSFVAQCSAGYDMSIYEYENDLALRAEIQVLLDDSELQRLEGYREFCDGISSVDRDFMALLQEGVEIGSTSDPWWTRGVLRQACAELARDFMNIHGVRIRVV